MEDWEKIEKIAWHMWRVSEILGIPMTDSNEKTPERLAKMWVQDVFRSLRDVELSELGEKITMFPDEYSEEMQYIIIKDIHFSSMCEHHWLPFFGTVDIGYVPGDKILGLSKFPRIVRHFSKKPQLQERLTNEIGLYINEILHPSAVFVRVEATHTCVMCRGIENPCTTTTTYFNSENCMIEERDFFRRLG